MDWVRSNYNAFRVASPQTSVGVRLSRGENECVTTEPQRTSAGRLPFVRTVDTFRFVLNVKIYSVLALFYIKRTFYMTV